MSVQSTPPRRGTRAAVRAGVALAAVAIVATGATSAVALADAETRSEMTAPLTAQSSTTAAEAEIRPFQVDFPRADIMDLRRRLEDTRWPSQELVPDPSQGVQLATVQELIRYWATEHDWRETEARLNALPQFVTEIDGLDIHFIHVKSPHPNALPLLITHGWPGSIIEMLGVIGPLTDPTASGGSAEDAFDVVIPSIPGYGFSEEPAEPGWNSFRIAGAWAELMDRLGYDRYVAQGGDVGAGVTDAMGRIAPEGLLGIHLNFLSAFPPPVLGVLFGGAPVPDGLSEEEAAAYGATAATFRRGYIVENIEHPQTIGYGQTDSPAGLAAWMLDHDADSYAKITKAFLDDQPTGGLTKESVVDNIALYWLTNTATSAARIYWESGQAIAAAAASGQQPPPMNLPAAYTVFPNELILPPRSWLEEVYPNLIYFDEAERGGHFAAWEEPELFAAELREAFRSLRSGS